MRFLLSIHDVWPGNFPLVAEYLASLRSLGAQNMALLVVPAYHGQAPMDTNPGFIAWLRAESALGTELFLHGHHHLMIESIDADYRRGRTAFGRWVNGKASREAEFCGLPRAEGDRLLGLGLESWRRTGLPLAGFVAPTWHGSPARESLRGHGVELRETRFRVERLSDGESRWAPPLAWDQSDRDRGPRLFGGEAWLRASLRLPLLKVAIHPGDLEGQGSLRVLERVFAGGGNIGYRGLFVGKGG